MRSVRLGLVEVERCLGCGGLWFEAGELELIREQDLDTAPGTSAFGGARSSGLAPSLDHVDDYPCPACAGKVVRLLAAGSRPARFETCSDCRGLYLDVGELAAVVQARRRLTVLRSALDGLAR